MDISYAEEPGKTCFITARTPSRQAVAVFDPKPWILKMPRSFKKAASKKTCRMPEGPRPGLEAAKKASQRVPSQRGCSHRGCSHRSCSHRGCSHSCCHRGCSHTCSRSDRAALTEGALARALTESMRLGCMRGSVRQAPVAEAAFTEAGPTEPALSPTQRS